jgi:MerR family transcriptional regulator/heat shock protein HspR
MSRRKRGPGAYTISVVANQFGIHPQTLRLYEREGLLKPSRTEGNTRLYTDEDMERLELILSFTRDLGVNLAGVEIIINMREKMEEMQRQMQEFVSYVTDRMGSPPDHTPAAFSQSLVPTRQPLPVKPKPAPSRARRASQER